MSASGHKRSMMTAPERLPLCPRKLPSLSTRPLGESRHPRLPVPSGKTAATTSATPPVKPISQNIPLYRISDLSYRQNTLARDKGRIAIVTNRGLGSDGRDGVGRNRHCRAASAVSNRFAPTTRRRQRLRMASGVSTRQHSKSQRRRARTNKSCGPDARGLCVKSCGDEAARPGARISYPQGDGGNSASLPGESTKDTLKPSRREGRAIRRTCGPPRVHFYGARTLRVPAGARPSLRPFLEGGASGRTRAKCAARMRTLARCLKCELKRNG
ncbi:hypothetical protein ACVWWG_008056 [Bradyrhizobium sp. LB7.2]